MWVDVRQEKGTALILRGLAHYSYVKGVPLGPVRLERP
jgi:hypothetical protein